VVPCLVAQEVREVQEVQVAPYQAVLEVPEVLVVPCLVAQEVLEERVAPCQGVRAVVRVGAGACFHHRSRHSFKFLHPNAWDRVTTMFEAV